jgi:hypothetical protein
VLENKEVIRRKKRRKGDERESNTLLRTYLRAQEPTEELSVVTAGTI